MKNKRILITGGAGLDRLAHRRSRWPTKARRDRRARQFRARPAREPAPGDAAVAAHDRRGRHPRPRLCWPRLCDGIDVVFHQAAIRITQCAEEPRLAFDVLATARSTCSRRRSQREGLEGRRRLVRLGARTGRELSDDRSASPVQQPHHLRRGQGVQRGDAAPLHRDVRPATTSRCAISTSTARAWTSTAPTPRC